MHAYHLQNGSYRGYLAQLSFAIIFIFKMIFSVTIFIENPPFFSIFYTPTGIESQRAFIRSEPMFEGYEAFLEYVESDPQ